MLGTIGLIRDSLVVLHIVGLAALFGGFLVQIRALRKGTAEIVPAMVHGAWTAFITGLALVGVAEWAIASGADSEINHIKIAVKTAVVLVILTLVMLQRKKKPAASTVVGTIGGLTLLNIILAVFW